MSSSVTRNIVIAIVSSFVLQKKNVLLYAIDLFILFYIYVDEDYYPHSKHLSYGILSYLKSTHQDELEIILRSREEPFRFNTVFTLIIWTP